MPRARSVTGRSSTGARTVRGATGSSSEGRAAADARVTLASAATSSWPDAGPVLSVQVATPMARDVGAMP